MAGVLSVQNVYVTQLFPQSVRDQAMISTQDLTNVAAVGGCPSPVIDGVEDGHPTFDPAVAESDAFNNFGPAIGGLSRASADKQKFDNIIPASSVDAGHVILGNVLDGNIELVEAMTPSGAYANQNPQRPSDGTVIKIKTTPGQVIKAPDSGRKISGSGDRYVGMVMYATADGVRYANSRNDKPTGNEGYNVYIWNINTDPSVISNYRRGHDEFKRKCFPQFKAGDTLGTAKGDYIYMALRDNGDFVSIRDVSWWSGKVTAGQASTGDGGTTLPTATPGGTVPTSTPTGSSAPINGSWVIPKIVQRETSVPVSAGVTTYTTEFEIQSDCAQPITPTQNLWPIQGNTISNYCTFFVLATSTKPKLLGKTAMSFVGEMKSGKTVFTVKVEGKYGEQRPLGLEFTIPAAGSNPSRVVNITVSPQYYEGVTPTTAPTAVPTGSPTAAPTAVPTALPTISSTGMYTRIELTREGLQDAGGVIPAIPGEIDEQIVWYFDNCGLSDRRYFIHENVGNGPKIADATCQKINSNKIVLTGFSINKKNIILTVWSTSQDKFLGGIVWNIR